MQSIAVVAAFAEGQTRLVNVPQARTKETDRIKCMAEELKKLSVDVKELLDGLIIHGTILNSRVTSHERRVTRLDGRGDHRIVMALAVAALALEGQSTIDTAEAMNVTFPDYVKLMKNLGANMELPS